MPLLVLVTTLLESEYNITSFFMVYLTNAVTFVLFKQIVC